MRLLLGIDLSTTGAKALLIDSDGHVVSSATTPLNLSTPHPLWSEQDPREWWTATANSIKQALATASTSGADVAAIGLTGQMHGLVLLDAKGEVLRPSIIWCDQRTEEQCRAITERVGARRLIELAANPALTGFTLPKIWWVRQNEPVLWKRAAHILL